MGKLVQNLVKKTKGIHDEYSDTLRSNETILSSNKITG